MWTVYAVPQTFWKIKKRYAKLAIGNLRNFLMSTSVGIVVLTLWRGLLLLHLFVLKGFLRTSYRRSGAYQFHASNVYRGLIGTVSPQSIKPILP